MTYGFSIWYEIYTLNVLSVFNFDPYLSNVNPILPEAQIGHHHISQNLCGLRKMHEDINDSSLQPLTSVCAIFHD
jgi:hypothetical protein